MTFFYRDTEKALWRDNALSDPAKAVLSEKTIRSLQSWCFENQEAACHPVVEQ